MAAGRRGGIDQETLEISMKKLDALALQVAEKQRRNGDARLKNMQKNTFNPMFNTLHRLEAGHYQEAIEHYSTVLHYNSEDASVLFKRATSFLKRQQWQKCIEVRELTWNKFQHKLQGCDCCILHD